MTSRDGCDAFDARLMDAAIDGDPGGEVGRHVAECARCADALHGYQLAAAAAAHALSETPMQRTAPRWRVAWLPIAAAAAAIVVFFGARALHREAPPSDPPRQLTVLPEEDADVRQPSPTLAVLNLGTSAFVLNDPHSIVRTPFGQFSCAEPCEFTVEITEAAADELPVIGCGMASSPALAGMTMKVKVAVGQVDSRVREQPTILGPGNMLNLPSDGISLQR